MPEDEEEPGTQEADEEEPETETIEDNDAIEMGDYVELEYTAWVEMEDEEGETEKRVIDTTDKEVAEEEGIDEEGRNYGPRKIHLGEGHIFEEIEEAIEGNEIGYSDTLTVSAENAFGEHDPDAVETVSANKIPEDDRYPGAQVQVDGRHGYIETIIGGRARVDFNHPLAGKDVTYDFEVMGTISDREEMAEGVVEMHVGASVDAFFGDEEDDEGETVEALYLEAPRELSMNQQWLFGKSQIAHELMHEFDVDRVVVRETYEDEGFHGGAGDIDMEDLMDEIDEPGDIEEVEAALDDEDALEVEEE